MFRLHRLPRRLYSVSVDSYLPQELPPAVAPNFVSCSRYPHRRGLPHGGSSRQQPGPLSPRRAVPAEFKGERLPPYARGIRPVGHPEPQVHSASGIARMRAASAVAAEVLAQAGRLVRPGVSADQIDDFVHRLTLSLGAYPSPLGYMGFPKSVCCSVNEVVCHGIPAVGALLRPGDIVKLDVSCYLHGVHGDTCRSWIVGGEGAGDAGARALVRTTQAALSAAIAGMGPGVPVRRVGDIIGPMAEAAGLEVITAFAGHGIGEVFHTQPIVYHHPNDSAYVLREGMTFTIEPMLVEGSSDVITWPDGWAIATADGGRAAQFEHTLLVTAHGVDVLTAYEE
jgi:methionyl aminopeptidase